MKPLDDHMLRKLRDVVELPGAGVAMRPSIVHAVTQMMELSGGPPTSRPGK